MATILPPVIVKPHTTRGRPRGAHTAPTAPFKSAPGTPRELLGHRRRARPHGGAVGADRGLGVEHRQQRGEVPGARGHQEATQDIGRTDPPIAH